MIDGTEWVGSNEFGNYRRAMVLGMNWVATQMFWQGALRPCAKAKSGTTPTANDLSVTLLHRAGCRGR